MNTAQVETVYQRYISGYAFEHGLEILRIRYYYNRPGWCRINAKSRDGRTFELDLKAF